MSHSTSLEIDFQQRILFYVKKLEEDAKTERDCAKETLLALLDQGSIIFALNSVMVKALTAEMYQEMLLVQLISPFRQRLAEGGQKESLLQLIEYVKNWAVNWMCKYAKEAAEKTLMQTLFDSARMSAVKRVWSAVFDFEQFLSK